MPPAGLRAAIRRAPRLAWRKSAGTSPRRKATTTSAAALKLTSSVAVLPQCSKRDPLGPGPLRRE
eukprot:6974201-Karenia_brevis.AAC.1